MTLGHIKADRGFTLIELLVVIAIIGILSSVVLASLNTARNRGADASIKSSLNNARAQAALFYDNTSTPSYDNVCTTGTNNISALLTAATNAGGTSVQCGDTADGWAANAQLKSSGAGWYCVDSTGYAGVLTTDTVADTSDVTCAS